MHRCLNPLYRSLKVLVLVLASFLVWSATSAAQDISEEEMATFESHLAAGGGHLHEQAYEQAIAELDRARQIIDHPRLSVSIAGAYLDWQRCAQASSEYRALEEREDLDDEQRQTVAQGLEQAQQDCVEHATLHIQCEPADAELRIDDEPANCPYQDDVPTGDYQIEVSADRHHTHQQPITVDAGSPTELSVELEPGSIDPVGEDRDWVPIASYGAIGTGAAMLLGGGILDYRAGSRSTEIAQAQQDGDTERLEELEASASSARTINAILYAGGLAFVAGGVALQLLGPSSDKSDDSGLSLHLSPTGIATTFRW